MAARNEAIGLDLDLEQIQRRYLVLLALRWLPVGLILPLLVLILTRELSLGQVGQLLAIYGITTAVLELPTGGLADSLGRRPVLVASSLGSIGMFVTFVSTTEYLWLGVAMFLGGVSRALDSGPLESWFVDSSKAIDPEIDLRVGLSRGGIVDGVVLALGAIAGGVLPQIFGGRLLVSVWCALAAQCAHVLGVLVLMQEPARSERRSAAAALSAVPEVVRGGVALATRSGPVRRLLLAALTIGVGLSVLETLWQPRFVDLLGGEQDTWLLGVLLAIAFVGAALGSAAAPRIGAFIERRFAWPATLGQIATAGTLAALAATRWVPAAVFWFVAGYVIYGVVGPLRIELVHENVPSDRRATMLSADSLVLQTGGFISALTLPALADRHGIPAAWLIGAIVLGLGGLFYLGVTGHKGRAAPVGPVAQG